MSEKHCRHGPRGTEGPVEDECAKSGMDTEGGGSHLVHVIAQNTLKEIIFQAKKKVTAEEGAFRIPAYVMDQLLIKCEMVLLNYGEEEALKCMVEEIKAHMARMREFKARDNERKVRERLPSKGEDHPEQHRRA